MLYLGENWLKRASGRRKTTGDHLLRKVAVLCKEAGRVSSFVRVTEPAVFAGGSLSREFARGAWIVIRWRVQAWLRRWLATGIFCGIKKRRG